jgi:ABC-type multidrug transport system ATPase subunit
MIADLDPSDGEVALGSVERNSIAGSAWRRLAPFVGAESAWWSDLVVDHFDPDRRETALALADRLGLKTHQFDGPVARLSTGERQRLSLVRALALGSPALLLDEPTGPLDPVSVEAVESILRERLAGGLVLVIVTHDLSQAERLQAKPVTMVDRRLEGF